MPSYVKGGDLKPHTWVSIKSRLGLDSVNEMAARPMAALFRYAQDIPILGRMAAHGTTMYWDAISKMEVGRAFWLDD